MIKKRQSRSDRYQYLILEINFSVFDTSDGSANAISDTFHYEEQTSQKMLDLKDQLLKRTMELLPEVCTKKQYTILMMRLDGYTQSEIAKELGVNQSSVTKCINGNIDYSDGKRKTYGGVIKKLQKHILSDKQILSILKEIEDNS